MDDKDKSAIEKLADTVKNGVGNIAKSAVMPTVEPDTAHLAGTANEQMYIPEASDAPMPAPQFAALDSKKRKVPAQLAGSKIPPKKAGAKKAKKSSETTSAKKRKHTVKKTARKVAKKKAKKSKR
jgi:hypothetical protein